jgi:translocation and assembly module TamB
MSVSPALRRGLLWLLGIPLALVLLAAVLGGIGVSTQTGLNALLGLANRYMPGQFSYEKISGRLWGPLHIEKLRYEDGPLKITLNNAELEWRPGQLLSRHLNIGRLHFDGLDIHLPPGEKTPPSTAPFVLPDLQLPIGITIADLQGRNIRLVPAEGAPLLIDAIDLKARTNADGLQIETFQIKSPLGEAQLTGHVNPTGQYPVDLDVAWQVPLANYGTFHGGGKLQGELRERLTLSHKITGPGILQVDGEVYRPLTEGVWSGKAKLEVADLKPFAPDLAGKPLTVALDAKGVMTRFQSQGEIKTIAPQLGPTTIQFIAAGDPNLIKLDDLRLSAPDHALTLVTQGEVVLANGVLSRFQSQGEINATAPELGPATLRFSASGDPNTIKLEQLRLTAPNWALTLLTQGEVQLANGTLARFQSKGDLNATVPEFGPLTLQFTADGDAKAIKLNELRVAASNRPLKLMAQGQVQLADLRFNATGQWQSLVWPLRGVAQVESAKGEFTAEGIPKDYRFTVTATDLRGPNIPKGDWTLTGQGSDQAVRNVNVVGKTLEGTLEATADATWTPAVGWKAALSGQGLNPGAHWKDVPGKLNFRLKTDGGLENGSLRANVLLEGLSGALRGQAVAGKADLSVRNQDLTIRALQISAGDARLEANGSLTERWDLAWKLNAPQLKSLLPNLSGTITSSGKLSGSRTQPVVAATFAVNHFRQGDIQIQQLRGDANIDIGSANRSRLQISGDALILGGQKWKGLRLDGTGTAAAHEIKVELNGDPGNFLLALAGSLQMPALVWQGRMTQLSAKDTLAGQWSLEKPAAIRASAQEASLESACLSSAPTRLCVQGQWRQPGDVNGRVQLTNLNAEQFKRFFPKGTSVATTVNGEATASGKIGGALQGKLDLAIAPGQVTTLVDGGPVRIDFNGGTVRLNTDGRAATGQARFDLGQTGQLQADLQVQDLFGARRLNGKIDAAITDLKIISSFVPQITEISGQIRANIGLNGTLTQPVARGDIRLDRSAIAIPEAGLKLQDIQFVAASTGSGIFQLSGSVRSDPGRLELSGQLDPLKPHLNLTIIGENFQAMKSTDIQVQISPDLKVDFTPQQTKIEGTLTIPRAFIRPGGQRPGVIKASDDVVIVKDRDGQTPKAKGQGMTLFTDVRVVLGREVYLETAAFKGKLQGDLQVVETPQLAPRGTGNIEVVAGKYKIYGEDIEIQRGQLLFSSSALDNPSLELRVVRQERNIISGDEIMAGAQIRGTLKKPKLTFFSSPKMSDPDILAYLVLGRAPGGSGNETAMLFKAASALGSGQGGGLTKSLSDAFGLDSAELGSTSQGGTSFMVGKYLTPRLYVGYGIALLNAVNTFFLKYQFTKHLMLETATNSLGTGGDFIYTIER